VSLLLLFGSTPLAGTTPSVIPLSSVIWNAYAELDGVTLSDHVKAMSLDIGQSTVEITDFSMTVRTYRVLMQNISAEIVFYNDRASGSVESTLRGLQGTTFDAVLQNAYTVTSTDNPRYEFAGLLDGPLELANDAVGEIPLITAHIVSAEGSLTVTTTSS
jgi:hypothetical protein